MSQPDTTGSGGPTWRDAVVVLVFGGTIAALILLAGRAVQERGLRDFARVSGRSLQGTQVPAWDWAGGHIDAIRLTDPAARLDLLRRSAAVAWERHGLVVERFGRLARASGDAYDPGPSLYGLGLALENSAAALRRVDELIREESVEDAQTQLVRSLQLLSDADALIGLVEQRVARPGTGAE